MPAMTSSPSAPLAQAVVACDGPLCTRTNLCKPPDMASVSASRLRTRHSNSR